MSCSVSGRLSIICFSHCRNDSSGAKGTNIYMVSKCNVFLPFVACCGRISSPILLRLCSELLAQALPICNELEEGLDFVLVNC